MHASLSLAKAYVVTQDPDHLEAALRGWAHFKTKHADDFIGSYTAGFNRDYTGPLTENGVSIRNFEYMLHAFETAMALADVTEGLPQEELRQDAYDIGQHIVDHMVQPDEMSWTGSEYTRALHYSYDAMQGTVNYSRLLPAGDLHANGQDVKWWPQAEAARAVAHFAIVRDRVDLWDEFELTFHTIQTHWIDPIYGGWFHALSPDTLLPD